MRRVFTAYTRTCSLQTFKIWRIQLCLRVRKTLWLFLQLNIESLDIADIVQEAVRLNDAVFLITQVKNRLYSHAPLRHEVEALRHR